MDSNIYDKYILECIGNKHIKKGTVYYDEAYENALKKSLAEHKLIGAYQGELIKNSQGTKMCSAASSSRLCYLASKTIYKGIDEHEKKDLKNGCCRPHFDGYDSENDIFYEFKCHELCSNKHDKITSKRYIPLLKNIFNINCNDPKELMFSDFGISIEGASSINSINFDFKQFVCHIIGLLSVANKKRKPTLKYVWVVPQAEKDKELSEFITMVKNQILDIFAQFSNVVVQTKNGGIPIRELIYFALEIVPVCEIPDFVLKTLR